MTRGKKYKEKIEKSRNFFQNDIWHIDLEGLGKYRARLIRNLRIALLTVKNFSRQNIGWQSVALSFFTTMAFVPFLAVIFAISNRIGMGEYLKILIYKNFGNQEIIDQLLLFAGNIIRTSEQGIYGIVSFLVFVWLVIWLMMCIERSFNFIWHVRKKRVLWRRLLIYLTTLVLSPFIIVIFLSVSLTITDGINTLGVSIPVLESISSIIVWLVFYFFMLVGLTLTYYFIPNAAVRFSPAFSASVLSALAFTVVQYLYLETQVMVSRMNAVYGVFAAVPLFMVWLNIGWFIVLLGSEISYAFQKVDSYPPEENKIEKQLYTPNKQ